MSSTTLMKNVLVLGGSLLLIGCQPASNTQTNDSAALPESSEQRSLSKHHVSVDTSPTAIQLGSIEQCRDYTGLPHQWLNSETSGMIRVPAGQFDLGSDHGYPDELNFGKKQRSVQAFWIDQTEVTVAQFKSFVDATGYVTDAEKQRQAAVFAPNPQQPKQWWSIRSDYTWHHPNGSSAPKALGHEPVRYVTQNDAQHYAVWLGRDLPTEIEWEYAAKAHQNKTESLTQAPVDHHQHPTANYWQGQFPFENLKQDQFEGVAPVGCFAANPLGLYDLIGNVWEWTNSQYQGAHDQHMGDYQSLRQRQHSTPNIVIKGGSFLCADNYCARYRSSSRHPQEFDLATTHVGFRTVLRK